MENEIKVKSLHKALEILNCFVGKDSLGVTEISERFGLCKSNVHNILYTFRQMGYLEQNEATGKYRLGNADICIVQRPVRQLSDRQDRIAVYAGAV